jgi:DNA-binding response OmpR family regulator
VASGAAEILRWPADADRREDLRRRGHPRLLLLEPGAIPPVRVDDLEDWTWTPTDERDLFARLNRLTLRARPHDAPAPAAIELGDDGVLAIGSHRVVLPPAEAAILGLLVDPPGRLRSRAELEDAVWGERPHGPRALDSRMFTLRTRVQPLGLRIHSVRGRGFTLGSSTTRTTQELP